MEDSLFNLSKLDLTNSPNVLELCLSRVVKPRVMKSQHEERSSRCFCLVPQCQMWKIHYLYVYKNHV